LHKFCCATAHYAVYIPITWPDVTLIYFMKFSLSFQFRDLRTKTPTQILLNFCIALCLTLIVFVVAAERSKTSSITSCQAAAIALHYFVLAVFTWMAIQAYNMHLSFVKIMPTDHSHIMIKYLIAGWGMLKERSSTKNWYKVFSPQQLVYHRIYLLP
jgi:hypothetical protein